MPSLGIVQNLSLVTRIHVLTAIKVHDQSGAAEFLADGGFDAPGEHVLVERGKRYDARALLAFAHGRATGTPLSPDEIPLASLKTLVDLGFTVALVSDFDRPGQTKTAAQTKAAAARAATRAAAKRVPGTAHTPRTETAKASDKPEPVVKLCPKCHTALPATGLCDYCD